MIAQERKAAAGAELAEAIRQGLPNDGFQIFNALAAYDAALNTKTPA